MLKIDYNIATKLYEEKWITTKTIPTNFDNSGNSKVRKQEQVDNKEKQHEW